MTEKLPKWLKILENGNSSVTEGQAEIIFSPNEVFYNPIQEYNRDISIAAIKVWSQEFLEERRRKKEKLAPLADGDDTKIEEYISITNLSEKATVRRNIHLKALASKKGSHIDLTDSKYDSYSFRILEAFSASGLRSIRYSKEIPRVGQIIANDLLPSAVESITRNALHNKVDNIVTAMEGDACQAAYKALASKKKYDVIDLDPYGSSAPFIDAAIQAVTDGGLLCVTCTDLAVLAGSQPESCFGKYGGMNVPNSPFTHELALRILLQALQSAASRYKLGIEVLMSCHIDYYVRVFVRVRHSAPLMKQASSKTAMLQVCQQCYTFVTQPLGKYFMSEKGPKYGPAVSTMGTHCNTCKSKTHTAGPFYSAPIHDTKFVRNMMAEVARNQSYGTWDRMAGMLMMISEELPDCPLYYVLPRMCNIIHCQTPALIKFVCGLLSTGYKVSTSHACTLSIKTDAPSHVVWDVLKEWVKLNPIKRVANQSSPAFQILAQESTTTATFESRGDAEPLSVKASMIRYQENPTPNWGPMSKPGMTKRKAAQVSEDQIKKIKDK